MILPLYQNIIIIYEPNSAVEIDTFFFFLTFIAQHYHGTCFLSSQIHTWVLFPFMLFKEK